MTKLYIDDLRNSPDDSWIVVRTLTGAIRVLATMDVDVISLDHDISHYVSVDGNARPFACVENFSAVCYFIGEKYKGLSPPSIILHTSNPVGAQRMRHILASYGLKSEYQPGKPVHR
jgi:hypothetical protein